MDFATEVALFGYYGTPEGLRCLASACGEGNDGPLAHEDTVAAYHARVKLCRRLRARELTLPQVKEALRSMRGTQRVFAKRSRKPASVFAVQATVKK